ncbi:MAG: hypothetical protein Q9216_002007 [Gyalolechia sp. 2 TL-2023]
MLPSPLSTDSGSKTSDVPPTSLAKKSLNSRRSDPPWKKLLEPITTPTLFKEVLLRTLPWDGVSGYVLHSEWLDDDISVIMYNSKTYYLRPDMDILHHHPPHQQQEADTFYSQLFACPEVNLTSPFNSANHASGDFFLPLGSLVETASEKSKGEKRLTNYIWALNISTDPVSLWLVFDYVTADSLDRNTTVDLCEMYPNQRSKDDQLLYIWDRAKPHGYLELRTEWDVLKVFDDIDKDWQPEEPRVTKLDAATKYLLGSKMRAYRLVKPPRNSPGLRIRMGEKGRD